MAMATGPSKGRTMMKRTRCRQPVSSSKNHSTATIARGKVAGRNMAPIMTLPQMGSPSLTEFAPLTRSEPTSKTNSPRSGRETPSTLDRTRTRSNSPSTKILARATSWCSSSQVTLVGHAEVDITSRKSKRRQAVLTSILVDSQGLASHCKAKTTFAFHFTIINA